MKKSLILLSICSAVLLTSCGTSSYYASSAFEDGIYYRPSKDARAEALADDAQVRELIDRTRQEAARFSDTILIAGANSTVDIPYIPETQYTLMFDNSLDSLGQVNINFNFDDWYPGYGYRNYYSYWDWRYWGVFGPSWHRWGWYDPWYCGWYDPWYCGWGWGFGFAWDPWYGPWGGWYAGWYGPGYWGWYDPWYGPWGYPVASFHPTYHGKRGTGTVRAGGMTEGGRRMASAGGSSVRTGGRQSTAAPSMSIVRGRSSSVAASADRTASGSTVRGGRTFQASSSAVNMGERYVSRGGLSNGTQFRRAAQSSSVSAGTGTFRRPASAASAEFRNPFESRSSSYSSGLQTRYQSQRDNGNAFNRSGINARTTVNSSTNNRSSVRSYSTGTVSRSSMGTGRRSYGGGGGSRSGGGVRR